MRGPPGGSGCRCRAPPRPAAALMWRTRDRRWPLGRRQSRTPRRPQSRDKRDLLDCGDDQPAVRSQIRATDRASGASAGGRVAHKRDAGLSRRALAAAAALHHSLRRPAWRPRARPTGPRDLPGRLAVGVLGLPDLAHRPPGRIGAVRRWRASPMAIDWRRHRSAWCSSSGTSIRCGGSPALWSGSWRWSLLGLVLVSRSKTERDLAAGSPDPADGDGGERRSDAGGTGGRAPRRTVAPR